MKAAARIETKRCILQLLHEEDINEATALFLSPQVRQYLGGPISEQAARQKLGAWIEDSDSLYYCVRLKNTRSFLGIVDISPYHDQSRKEVSYQFLPEAWGHGYAAEALESLILHCAHALQLDFLVAETQTANIRSRRLLEKLGFSLSESLERFGCAQSVYMRRTR